MVALSKMLGPAARVLGVLFLLALIFDVRPASALQAGLPLSPRQLEPLDQSYVAPPSVTFRWTPTEGATQYRLLIFREDLTSDEDAIEVIVDGATSYTHNSLTPGYSYVWTVQVDFATSGTNNDFFEFTLSDTVIPPLPPSGMFASDGEFDDEVQIYWYPSYRTAYYLLQRRAPGSADFVSIATIGDLREFSDKELTPGQHYAYRALACNSAGCSAPSPVDEGWIGVCEPIAAPTLVAPEIGAVIYFAWQSPWYNLQWQPVEDARGYIVRIWDMDTGNMVENETMDYYGAGEADYFEVTGIAGHLAWNVRALNPVRGCEAGPPSQTWTYTGIQYPPPAVPTNVEATDGAYPDKIVITWEQPPAESIIENWQIWRSTSPVAFSAVEIASLPAGEPQPVEDTEVTPGTTYYYWVEACSHGDGCSDKSAPDTGYAGDAAPINEVKVYIPSVER